MAKTPTPAAVANAGESETAAATPAAAAPETTEQPTEEAPTPPASFATVEARVLRDHDGHAVDDVALLLPDEVEAAVTDGWADPNPAAVANAKRLKV